MVENLLKNYCKVEEKIKKKRIFLMWSQYKQRTEKVYYCWFGLVYFYTQYIHVN